MKNKTKETVIKEFAHHDRDTGSIEVQVALLTERIGQLVDHFKKFPKDFSSKRGLIKMVAKRRKSLAYLERVKPEEYKALIQRLELRK
jgi:small subunit ribosomal protein S15